MTPMPKKIDKMVEELVRKLEDDQAFGKEERLAIKAFAEDVIKEVLPDQLLVEMEEGDTGWNDAIVAAKTRAVYLGLDIM